MTEWEHRAREVVAPDRPILRIDPSAAGGRPGMASPLRAGETLAVDRLGQIFAGLIDALRQIDRHAAVNAAIPNNCTEIAANNGSLLPCAKDL